MATSDKLQAILNSKEAIRTAINDKGVVVEKSDSLSSYASKIEEISIMKEDAESDILRYVNWYNTDGTLLKAEVLHQGELATPPSDPSYDEEILTFDGWTSPFDYSSDTEHDNDIGAMYKPIDGKTHIKIALSDDNYTVGLAFRKGSNNLLTINWGDGSEIDTFLEMDDVANHTYTTAGIYNITAFFERTEPTNYNFGFGNSSNNKMFTGTGNSKIISLYLADQFTRIKEEELSYTSTMEVVTLCRSLKYIEEKSFLSASYLRILILPSTILNVYKKAFQDCNFLQHMVFPNCRASSEFIWYGCKALINIVFSEAQSGLGQYSFNNCSSLKRVSTTSSLQTLGTSTFENASNLELITDMSGCRIVGSKAFKSCSNLISIDLPLITTLYFYAFQRCSNLKSVNLGSGLNKIPISAFDCCYNLKSVYFTDSIKTIEYKAFSNCNSLSDISSLDEVANIGYEAFLSCASLKSANVNGFIDYTRGMFSGCHSLEEATIPENAGDLTYYFSNCYSLKSVHLPLGITSMTNYTFRSCYNLKEVTVAKDFDCNIMMNESALSRDSLLNIAQNIKDNRGLSAKQLNLQYQVIEIVKTMQVIDNGDDTIRVASLNENGFITLLEYIANKNWTVY